MRLLFTKILLFLHLSTLFGYNLFNGVHDFLHWIESEWHHHPISFQQFHSIEDHQAAFQAFKEKQAQNQTPLSSSLHSKIKVYYAFVYIAHFQNLFLGVIEKIPPHYLKPPHSTYQDINLLPLLPPPR